MDPKRFALALPRTLTGYGAKAPDFESAGVALLPRRSHRCDSTACVLVPVMYEGGAKYLKEDDRNTDERTAMRGMRRAPITEVNKEQLSAEALVADRFIATLFCPKGGFDGRIRLAQEISLDKLEAVK